MAAMPQERSIEEAIEWLTDEAVWTSWIEDVIVERAAVRAAIRRRFGRAAGRGVAEEADGIAAMLTSVYQDSQRPVSHEMLRDWHRKVMRGRWNLSLTGAYRAHAEPMQVVSSHPARRHYVTVHYQAPPSDRMAGEMDRFIAWFNGATRRPEPSSALEVAAISHLHFVQIHPFEDGNGRTARALAEKALARCIGRPSLIPVSEMIASRRNGYYAALQQADKTLDVTSWAEWFAETVIDAQAHGRLKSLRFEQRAELFGRLKGAINARQEKVLKRLFAEEPQGFKGGLSIKNYMVIAKASEERAGRDLDDLVTKGALRKSGEPGRARYWLKLTT